MGKAPAAEGGLSISTLARRSGVPVPTIHHYRRLGLLPAARTRGRRFLYDERHVEALTMIRDLRSRHRLPLRTIAEVLPSILERPAARDEILDLLVPCSPPTALVDAARDAFAESGYDGVSVADLCARIGIAKGTLYRWFPSKETLYAASVRSVGEEVASAVAGIRCGTGVRAAGRALEPAFAPYVPLVVEALSRELRGARSSAGMVEQLLSEIVDVLAARIRPSGRRDLAHQAVVQALGRAVLVALQSN